MIRSIRCYIEPRNLVLGLLVLLAAAEFVVRGPLRFAQNSSFNDFISPYTQSRAWLKGIDPYSPANLVLLWPRGAERPEFLGRDLADGSLVFKRGIPTAYPPTCFLLLAPLAVFPWRLAHALWLIVNLVGYGSLVLSLAAFMRLGRSNSRIYLFLFLSLALAPFHTGLGAGSIVIVAVAVSAVAFVAGERKQEICAGMLLSVAIGLKPQIGLPFLVYFLLRRRWRLSRIAMGAVAILASLAILRLAVPGTPWINNYIDDNTVLFSRGSLGDFTEADPIRFSLINLQVLLYAVLRDRATANVLALTVAVIMLVAWIVLLRPRAENTENLLTVSAIVVISLLPMYHRLYDASLLIFPLSWSLTSLSSGRTGSLAKMTLCLIFVFLVPGGTLLEYLEHTNHTVAALRDAWWWTVTVMPHEVWAIFALGLVLLQAMRVTRDVNGKNLEGMLS